MNDSVSQPLLQYADVTKQLLALAQSEQWDEWLQLLMQRDALFEQWRSIQQIGQIGEQTRAIVRETLQCNQQMEALVAARYQELSELLHSARQQHKLSSTYR
jgi:hypothetical protein